MKNYLKKNMAERIGLDSPKIIGGEFAIAPDVLEGALKVCDYNIVDPSQSHNLQRSSDDGIFLFSSGRAALYAILSAEGMDSQIHVSVPDYLCSSVIDAISDAETDYCFYHITSDLYPDMDSLFGSMKGHGDGGRDAIILINYFGLLNLENIIVEIRRERPDTVIILDDVQNYYGFGVERDFDYAFTSIRKWFPVPDGGILKINKRKANISSVYKSMNEDNAFVSYKLAGNVLKTYRQVIPDSISLELIERGEEILDQKYKCRMSDISQGILSTFITDIRESVGAKRISNGAYLHKGLERIGIRHIYDECKVPLFIPIFVDPVKRDRVRKRMFDNNIFCPVHWKKFMDADSLNGSDSLYDMELSLICDQRYDEEDMRRILEILEHECDNYG